jgi:hypothetical protein
LKSLSVKERQVLVAEWGATGSAWSKCLSLIAEAWAAGSLSAGSQSVFFNDVQGLFTYNGDWGVLDKASLLGDAWPTTDLVVEQLRCSDCLKKIEGELAVWIAEFVSKGYLDKWAWSIELCTATYEAARREVRNSCGGRAEATVFLANPGGIREFVQWRAHSRRW